MLMLSVILLNVLYAERPNIMLRDIMLKLFMLHVIMLKVIMLNVLVPPDYFDYIKELNFCLNIQFD